jgi:hypothetical protein
VDGFPWLFFASQKIRVILLSYLCEAGVSFHLIPARTLMGINVQILSLSMRCIYLSIFLLSPFLHVHLFSMSTFFVSSSSLLSSLSPHFVAQLHPMDTYMNVK